MDPVVSADSQHSRLTALTTNQFRLHCTAHHAHADRLLRSSLAHRLPVVLYVPYPLPRQEFF
eukprot:scaffold316399_cov47-Attheya_sp.AAC.1